MSGSSSGPAGASDAEDGSPSEGSEAGESLSPKAADDEVAKKPKKALAKRKKEAAVKPKEEKRKSHARVTTKTGAKRKKGEGKTKKVKKNGERKDKEDSKAKHKRKDEKTKDQKSDPKDKRPIKKAEGGKTGDREKEKARAEKQDKKKPKQTDEKKVGGKSKKDKAAAKGSPRRRARRSPSGGGGGGGSRSSRAARARSRSWSWSQSQGRGRSGSRSRSRRRPRSRRRNSRARSRSERWRSDSGRESRRRGKRRKESSASRDRDRRRSRRSRSGRSGRSGHSGSRSRSRHRDRARDRERDRREAPVPRDASGGEARCRQPRAPREAGDKEKDSMREAEERVRGAAPREEAPIEQDEEPPFAVDVAARREGAESRRETEIGRNPRREKEERDKLQQQPVMPERKAPTVKCAAANDEEDLGILFDIKSQEPKVRRTVPGAERQERRAGESQQDHSKRKKEFAWMDSDDDEEQGNAKKDGTAKDEEDAGGDKEELDEVTIGVLEEVHSFGRMMLLAPALKQMLGGASLVPAEVLAACRALARAKFFDGDILEDLYEVLKKLLQAGALEASQTDDAIHCFAALNAYDRGFFNAVAKAWKAKTAAIPPLMRAAWLEVFKVFGHTADADFLQLLEVPPLAPTNPSFRKVRCWHFSRGSCVLEGLCTFSHDDRAPLSLVAGGNEDWWRSKPLVMTQNQKTLGHGVYGLSSQGALQPTQVLPAGWLMAPTPGPS